jgi:protein tyrosine phosphatase
VFQVNKINPFKCYLFVGVGRTGTLVALDSLIQQLNEEGQVSIFNTICDMRHQRNYLVQSLVRSFLSKFLNVENDNFNLIAETIHFLVSGTA